MLITVLPTRYQPTPASDGWDTRTTDAAAVDLDDALARPWPTDSHFTAYAPHCPPELEGAAVRLESDALHELAVEMVLLVGDLDDPHAHATGTPAREEWRAEQRERFIGARLQVYETRGGFRVMAVLKEPVVLRSAADARAWRAMYLGWCAELESRHGLRLDRACADWTRLFRLPNVRRDGVNVRARLEGPGFPIVDAMAIQSVELPTGVEVDAADDRDLTDAERVDLDAAAEIIGPSFELGHRHMLALGIGGWLRSQGMPPEAARYLLAQLPCNKPEDREADALKAWTVDGAVMGWSEIKAHLPPDALASLAAVDVKPSATKATLSAWADRQATRAERRQAAAPADGSTDPYALLGDLIDLSAEPEPLAYLVEGLPFAPGGKVNALAAPPNGGKSPFALWLAICVACGLQFLGRRVLTPGPCLYLDAETGYLARVRFHRMCRALGLNPATVPLEFRDVATNLTVEYVDMLERYLTATPRALVVIDTYGAMLDASIDYNSAQFAHWLKQLGKLSRVLKVVIVVLVHERKRTAGSAKATGLEMIAHSFTGAGAMQGVVSLRPEGEGEDDPIVVSCSRAPEKKFAPFAIRWSDVPKPGSESGGAMRQLEGTDWGLRVDVTDAAADELATEAVSAVERDRAQRIVAFLKAAGGGVSKTAVCKNVAGTAGEIGRLVLRLADAGVLVGEVAGKVRGEPLVHYDVAPPSSANREARMIWLV